VSQRLAGKIWGEEGAKRRGGIKEGGHGGKMRRVRRVRGDTSYITKGGGPTSHKHPQKKNKKKKRKKKKNVECIIREVQSATFLYSHKREKGGNYQR